MAKSQCSLLRVMQKKWLISELKPSLNTWLLFSEDSLEQGTILFNTFPSPQLSLKSLRPRFAFTPLLSPSPIRCTSRPKCRAVLHLQYFCMFARNTLSWSHPGMGLDNRTLVLLCFSLLFVWGGSIACPHSPKQRLGLLASLVIALLLCAHLHAYENVIGLP